MERFFAIATMNNNQNRRIVWIGVGILTAYLVFTLLVMTHILALPTQAITAATTVLMFGILAVRIIDWMKATKQEPMARWSLGIAILVLIIVLVLLVY